MKWDTTPLPKRYTDSKKVKQCKNAGTGFLSSPLPLFLAFLWPIFGSLHHKNELFLVSTVKLHERKSVISKAFIQKSFFSPPPPHFLWWKLLSHYLAQRWRRDINWTRNRKVTFYVMLTALWYLDCEGRWGGWRRWWEVAQHAIHCWAAFSRGL